MRLLCALAAVATLVWATAADASVEGDLRAALRASNASLNRCYDRELKRDKPATGTVIISLVIRRDGKPGKVKLAKANKRQTKVGNCLVKKLKRLRLPAQESRVAVRLPVRLKARGG